MRSNYKPIGKYVRKVDVRNTDLRVSRLMGLSMDKEFRETTSNIIGTDMSAYKIMKKYQFACDFMSPIRVSKLPVVLKLDDELNLVSPAYPVFEVVDVNELDPEYLMMWFRRPEFDRYATFKCDAAIRGGYDWKELCETMIPKPKIDKQREVVQEYNSIQAAINLHRTLIAKLEATTETIYKEWFVDFNFPDHNGRPYKTNGGEFSETKLGTIPSGWEVKSFTDIVLLQSGGTPSTGNPAFWNEEVSFYTPADLEGNYYVVGTSKKISALGLKNCSSILFPEQTSFITARGATLGGVALSAFPMAMNQTCYAVNCREDAHYYAHQLVLDIMSRLKREAVGATFDALVTRDFDMQQVVCPPPELRKLFSEKLAGIYAFMLNKTLQQKALSELQNLLLSRLATIED